MKVTLQAGAGAGEGLASETRPLLPPGGETVTQQWVKKRGTLIISERPINQPAATVTPTEEDKRLPAFLRDPSLQISCGATITFHGRCKVLALRPELNLPNGATL